MYFFPEIKKNLRTSCQLELLDDHYKFDNIQSAISNYSQPPVKYIIYSLFIIQFIILCSCDHFGYIYIINKCGKPIIINIFDDSIPKIPSINKTEYYYRAYTDWGEMSHQLIRGSWAEHMQRNNLKKTIFFHL